MTMRRIFADVTTLPTDLVTKPDARMRRLRIAEPDAGNSGPTKFQGTVNSRPRSAQELLVSVERGGSFDAVAVEDGYSGRGARFTFKPDHLRDYAGAAVVDDVNALGADTFSTPRLTQLLNAPSVNVFTSPKMTKLERWGDYSPGSAAVGIAVCIRVNTGSGNFNILAWRMFEYDVGAGVQSYVWEIAGALSTAVGAVSCTNVPSCDVVEMPDGSIVVMIAYDANLEFWKSYDGGGSWELASKVTVTSRRWYCALDRIGSRLVAVYSYLVAGVSHTAYAVVSDDGGQTWSDATTVYDIASAPKANEFLDLVVAQSGEMYLFEPGSGGGLADTYGTTDGVNWTNVYGAGGTVIMADSFVQDTSGRWMRFCVYYDSGGPYKQLRAYHFEGNPNFFEQTPTFLQSGSDMLLDSDVAGLDADEVCARSFMDGGFVDVFTIFSDDDSAPAATYYMPVIVRCYMWAGLQLGPDVWDRSWAAYAYPSPSDAHPNMQWWTRTLVAGGVSSLQSTELGYLKFTTAADSDEIFYELALPANSWDTGIVARFELKVVNGTAKVSVTLCSDPSDKDVKYMILFRDTDQIQLVDVYAATILQTITPTNWGTTEWNEYVLVSKGSTVELYRAPVGTYREVVHHELVFTSVSELQEDAFGTDDDVVKWGILYTGIGDEAGADVRFRNFMYALGATYEPPIGWDFDADNVGRRCVSEKPVGLLQGISCKWGGIGAVGGDVWELDVGAVYEAENVFVKSPSIKWWERDLAGASPATTFTWERPLDANSNEMKYRFNAFAMFGRNFQVCALYGENAGGGGAVLLFNDSGSPTRKTAAEWTLQVDTVSGSVITPTFNALAREMVPNQYASDDSRKWYVRFTTGSLAGRIFKIIGNDETRFFMEVNIAALGLSHDDNINVFSDRMAYVFTSEKSYARLRLVVESVRTSPSELGLMLGHVVIGSTVALPDDEWESSIERVPYVSQVVGRAGRQNVVQLGGHKRVIKLAYTGAVDHGMGRESVAEFLRHMRNGERPFVWLDDVQYESSMIAYPEPILVAVAGGFEQRRVSYSRVDEYHVGTSIGFNRNVLDISNVVLEEVL